METALRLCNSSVSCLLVSMMLAAIPYFPVCAQESVVTDVSSAPMPAHNGKNPVTPPFWEGITKRYSAEELLAKIMKLAGLSWTTPQAVEEILEIKFKPPVSDSGVGTVFTSEPDVSGYRFVFSKEGRKIWTLKVIDIDTGKRPGNCLLHPYLVRTFLDTGWELDSQSFGETKYEKSMDGLFSTVLSSPQYTGKPGCLASMVLTNRSIGAAPVWKGINSRFTSDELFKTIMQLASQDWVTPKQVEEAFGIRFKPPQLDKGSVGNIYVAEGDNTRDGNSFVLGSALKLFHNENSTSPSWTLILRGFSNGLSKDKCTHYTDARQTILDMGWTEVPIPNEIRYEKHSDSKDSLLHISAQQPINNRRCLDHIQFSNQLRVSPTR